LTAKSPLDIVIWNGPGTDPSTGKQIAQPEFSTEVEELQWLLTKADPLKDVTPTMQADNLLEPPDDAIWPGPYTSVRPDLIAQQTAQLIWDQRRHEILQQQQDLNILLAQQKAAREYEKQQKIDAETRKRKSEGPTGPAAKKARLETEAQSRAEQTARNAEIIKAQESKRKELEKAREGRQKRAEREERYEEAEAELTALKQAEEGHAVSELAAAAKAVAEQIAKDAEERRLKFIATQQAAAEKRKRDQAKTAAQAGAAQRALLFKEKYGLSPTKELKRDGYGNYESGQGRMPPSGSNVLPPEEEVQEGLKATLQSLWDPERKQSARARLEIWADKEGKSLDEYVQARGFQTADAYLDTARQPLTSTGKPNTGLPPEHPQDVFEISRYFIQAEAQKGLNIRATVEGRSVEEIVTEKGYENLGQYLQALQNSIRLQDMPPAPVRNHRGEITNATKIYKLWSAVTRRITDVGEWEYRIRALPRAATPRVDRHGLVYAEI
jgi:hypothetical protein